MADIFVSYASDDRERVKPLVAALEDHGWRVWWDRELVVGPNYNRKIEEALDDAGCVVVIWSAHAIQSTWVQAEANEGLERDILVPVLIDDVRPPLPFRMSQSAEMFEWPRAPGQLADVIEGIVNLLGRPDVGDSGANSIAVLPFFNMSNDPDQEYFSDGISEDILNGLVKFQDLKVIARTSSFAFNGENRDVRTIGEQLSVNHVLEGSVRKAGDRIRVTAQLISTDDGAHIWSEQYDRELTDVFAVQDDITERILRSLGMHFQEPGIAPRDMIDTGAYNAYLLGRYHVARAAYTEAAESYKQAIAAEPGFAPGHAGLAEACYFLYIVSSDDVWRLQSWEHAEDALRLDPNDSVALALQALHLFFAGELQAALDSFAALTHQVSNETRVLMFYWLVLMSINQPQLCLELTDRYVALDPLDPLGYNLRSNSLLLLDRPDEAERALDQAERFGMPIWMDRCVYAFARGDRETIQAEIDKDPAAVSGVDFKDFARALLAFLDGDTGQVEALHRTLMADASYNLTFWYVARMADDVGEALAGVRRALAKHEVSAFMYATGASFYRKLWPEFCDHPELQKLRAEFGIDDASLAKLRIQPLEF